MISQAIITLHNPLDNERRNDESLRPFTMVSRVAIHIILDLMNLLHFLNELLVVWVDL